MISYDLINEKHTYGDETKEAKMSEGPRLSCCLTDLRLRRDVGLDWEFQVG
jgi:hypothetical protein